MKTTTATEEAQPYCLQGGSRQQTPRNEGKKVAVAGEESIGNHIGGNKERGQQTTEWVGAMEESLTTGHDEGEDHGISANERGES